LTLDEGYLYHGFTIINLLGVARPRSSNLDKIISLLLFITNKEGLMKTVDLILIRGVPGAGKTTFMHDYLNYDGCVWLSADDHMVDEDGNYEYDQTRVAECHKKCQAEALEVFKYDDGHWTIIVANTFCAEWEMDAYIKMHEQYGNGGKIHTIIVENRHGSKSVHDVPDDKIEMMKTKLMDSIVL